ncbi:MAG: hypothetical protein KBT22_11645, partial [Bacteroidales bacterium]|nr:hypothetical protein [Candidatus Scybalocola fimicaballi]
DKDKVKKLFLMNKNKLITFILNDISELDMLTKCMESMETIPYAMHDLALQKVRNILSEFEQLSVESKEEAQHNSEACKDVKSFVAPEVNDSEKSAEPVVEKVEVAKPQIEQEQVVNIKEELVSPKKNATIEVDVTAIDTVKVAAKEPEPQVVEELKTPEPVAEVKKEVAKPVEPEVPSPVKRIERPATEQPKANVGNPIITNERFKGSRRLESRFVTDLKKALNLNDRLRYQRELFGGDMSLLNATIEKLNVMSSLQDAEAYVAENFNWDTTEGAALEFMELLEARFTN